jgi:hypothetical protein
MLSPQRNALDGSVGSPRIGWVGLPAVSASRFTFAIVCDEMMAFSYQGKECAE